MASRRSARRATRLAQEGGAGGCDLPLCLCDERSHQAQVEFLYDCHFASRRAGRATRVLLDIDASAFPETFLSRIEADQPPVPVPRLGPHCQAGLIAGMDSAVGHWSGWNLEDRFFSPMHWESREASVAGHERPETRQWLERLRALTEADVLHTLELLAEIRPV